jgi:hypothetical protein
MDTRDEAYLGFVRDIPSLSVLIRAVVVLLQMPDDTLT